MKSSEEAKRSCAELIVKEILEKGPRELCAKNPMVLSCGGIYLPSPKRTATVIRYHVLTTTNEQEPVKVVTGTPPRNILFLVMAKEAMN